jgi:hypothetical protein
MQASKKTKFALALLENAQRVLQPVLNPTIGSD